MIRHRSVLAAVWVASGHLLCTGGCSIPMESETVVARWTETLPPLREDKRIRYGPPIMGEPAPAVEGAWLCIKVWMARQLSYKERLRHRNVAAVRCNLWGLHFTRGHGHLANLAGERQARCIERLKAGSPVAWDDVDRQVSFRRVVADTQSTVTPHREDLLPVPASGLRVRLMVDGNSLATATTGHRGLAKLALARTLADALRLSPCEAEIQAETGGKWLSLETLAIGKATVEAVVGQLQDKSMRVRGVSLGVPFAQTSLDVKPDPLRSGAECCLRLTVRNVGQGTFYGLAATSSSALTAANGLRFRFGFVPQGTRLTLTRPVRIPADAVEGQSKIRIEFSEYNGQAPDPLLAQLQTTDKAPPASRLDRNSGYSKIPRAKAVDAGNVHVKTRARDRAPRPPDEREVR